MTAWLTLASHAQNAGPRSNSNRTAKNAPAVDETNPAKVCDHFANKPWWPQIPVLRDDKGATPSPDQLPLGLGLPTHSWLLPNHR